MPRFWLVSSWWALEIPRANFWMARTRRQRPTPRTPKKKETSRDVTQPTATSRNPSPRSTTGRKRQQPSNQASSAGKRQKTRLISQRSCQQLLKLYHNLVQAPASRLPLEETRGSPGQLAKELAARRQGLASLHITRIVTTGRCRQIMLNARRAAMKTG